ADEEIAYQQAHRPQYLVDGAAAEAVDEQRPVVALGNGDLAGLATAGGALRAPALAGGDHALQARQEDVRRSSGSVGGLQHHAAAPSTKSQTASPHVMPVRRWWNTVMAPLPQHGQCQWPLIRFTLIRFTLDTAGSSSWKGHFPCATPLMP